MRNKDLPLNSMNQISGNQKNNDVKIKKTIFRVYILIKLIACILTL
jgi:hypothetical protein